MAEANVKALDSAVLGGSKFLLDGPNASWSDVARIVKRNYPGSGSKITEDIPVESWPVDTTKVERVDDMEIARADSQGRNGSTVGIDRSSKLVKDCTRDIVWVSE